MTRTLPTLQYKKYFYSLVFLMQYSAIFLMQYSAVFLMQYSAIFIMQYSAVFFMQYSAVGIREVDLFLARYSGEEARGRG